MVVFTYNWVMLFNFLKILRLLVILVFFNHAIFCHAISIFSDPNHQNNSFKIAIVGSLTSNYAAYGKQLLLATNQAINDLKEQNFLEVIPFDDQCNPDLAKSIAIKISKDPQIKAVIGHTCSAATIAASPIYAKRGILHIIPSPTNPKITESHINTLFRMSGRDDIQAQYISHFLAKKFKDQKIAILNSQDPYSKELAEYVQEYLAILKGSPTLYQSVAINDFNNYSKIRMIIKKLEKLKIDVIFFSGLYRETASIIKAMHFSKINIPIIVADSTATLGFIETLGTSKIAVGTMMSFQKLDLTNPLIPDLKITGQALFGYAAIQVIYEAIKNNIQPNVSNHSLNGRILSNWLHNNKVQTILGEKSWDTNGDVTDSEFNIYIWDENGQYWPFSYQHAQD